MKLNEEKLDNYLRALTHRVVYGYSATPEDEKLLEDVAGCGLCMLEKDEEVVNVTENKALEDNKQSEISEEVERN